MRVPWHNVIVYSSICSLLCYMSAFYHYFIKDQKNECGMTYLTAMPRYLIVSMAGHVGSIYKRYSLYYYTEATEVRQGYSGLPVLFIPGSGGSYKQVRSLATNTLFHTKDVDSLIHFDFFTVHFSEEWCGTYGGLIQDQQAFVIAAIKKILGMYYLPERKPKSVILVGHSMGGMIAKSLYTNSNFKPESVKLIITLATPHMPVLLIDTELKTFYNDVNTFWDKERSKEDSVLKNVTLISIGGGVKDVQVWPGYTFSKHANLNVLTSAIPDVIASTDHKAVVWCKPLLSKLAHVLYDAIDFQTNDITNDTKYMNSIFYYHLVHTSNGEFYSPDLHQERIKFNPDHLWHSIESNKNHISVEFEGMQRLENYLIVKLPKKKDYEDTIFVQTYNILKRDWIAVCKAVDVMNGTVYCEDGFNLSKFGTIGFSSILKLKYLKIRTSTFFDTPMTHVVVKVHQPFNTVKAHMELFRQKPRTIKHSLNFFWTYNTEPVIGITAPGALSYTIRLTNMYEMWKVYKFYLQVLNCTESEHRAYALFHTPWNQHDTTHSIISYEEKGVLILRMLTIPPTDRILKGDPVIDLILDPFCTYTAKIEPSYLDSMGVIAARYSLSIPTNAVAVLLLTLYKQYHSFYEYGLLPPFLGALKATGHPWMILIVVNTATVVWEHARLDRWFPMLDTQILKLDTVDMVIVPVFLYLIAFSLVYSAGVGLWWILTITVKYSHNFQIGCIFFDYYEILIYPSWRESIKLNVPLILAVVVYLVGRVTCTGFGLILLVICDYIFLCREFSKCYYRLKGELSAIRTTEDDDEVTDCEEQTPDMRTVHFHITIFFLFCICVAIYLPATMTFFQQISYVRSGWLRITDSNGGYNFIIISLAYLFWILHVPKTNIYGYETISYLIYVGACCTLLWSQVHLYRLQDVILPTLTIIALHQVLFKSYAPSVHEREYRRQAAAAKNLPAWMLEEPFRELRNSMI